ncbi:MAG: rod shape-determining protein MreD [Candidatus Pacebacteria bacterium]|nr:rod shape-determining protein MreD [Candidatus Paceibacterota bacterium]
MNNEVNYYKLVIILLAAFFLQTTLFGQLLGFFSPNLILMILVAGAFLSCDSDFLIVAFLSGVVLDIFSSSGFGIFPFCFLMTLLFVCFLKAKFIKERNFAKIIIFAALAAIFCNLLYFFIFYFVFSAEIGPDYGFLLQRTAWDLILSAIFVHPFIRMISK